MVRHILLVPILTAVLSIGAAVGQQNPCNPCAKAQNPCNPCGAKAMPGAPVPVNPCHAKLGTVFHIADPMGRNSVTFASRAPLEDIIGTTNGITGYIVFDPDKPEKGGRGEFLVPVGGLNTGIPLRDEHLQGKDWLNAGQHPNISFSIHEVEDVTKVKTGEGFTTYQVRLIGEFSLHGTTRDLEMPARVTYMRESDQTKMRLPGSLLAGRAAFSLNLTEYGITGPAGMDLIGNKVSDRISLDISFVASSAAPGMAANPCNPCAKGKNPCNPCAKKP